VDLGSVALSHGNAGTGLCVSPPPGAASRLAESMARETRTGRETSTTATATRLSERSRFSGFLSTAIEPGAITLTSSSLLLALIVLLFNGFVFATDIFQLVAAIRGSLEQAALNPSIRPGTLVGSIYGSLHCLVNEMSVNDLPQYIFIKANLSGIVDVQFTLPSPRSSLVNLRQNPIRTKIATDEVVGDLASLFTELIG